jgi:hypothetical protein
MWTLARLRSIVTRLQRVMFKNEGCSNDCSYGELFEMWIIEMLRRVLKMWVASNYCCYGELI